MSSNRTMPPIVVGLGIAMLVSTLSCRMSDDPPKKDDSTSAPIATTAETPTPQVSAVATARPANAPKFIDAPPTGEVPDAVLAQLAVMQEQGHLIVYVGATWCEPCQRFHEAVKSAKLDNDLPGFTFLAFDMDRDRERLLRAGYQSHLIPLFVVPGPEGRSSGKQIEGSVVGPGSPQQITPRLLALVAK
jgi:hypothetical protein